MKTLLPSFCAFLFYLQTPQVSYPIIPNDLSIEQQAVLSSIIWNRSFRERNGFVSDKIPAGRAMRIQNTILERRKLNNSDIRDIIEIIWWYITAEMPMQSQERINRCEELYYYITGV